jgi:cardiolipin synthase (CMP-forming)
MKGRIWTVPNQITLLRLGFLPVFLTLISYERYKWASSLGAYLDPIADKLLLSSSFVILAYKQKIAWWLTIIVLSRDILILVVAIVIILISGYRPFPPSIFGKLTTFFEIALVFAIVLVEAYPNTNLGAAAHALLYVVAAFATFSAFHYSFGVTRHHANP